MLRHAIEKRSYLPIIGVLIALSAVLCGCLLDESDEIPADSLPPGESNVLSAHGSARATAYGNANKILRFGSSVFATYLDYDGSAYQVKVAELDANTLAPRTIKTIGVGESNHSGATMIFDRLGAIHAFYGAHGQPLKYRYTTGPRNSDWSAESLIGDVLTYPSAAVLTWRT